MAFSEKSMKADAGSALPFRFKCQDVIQWAFPF